MHAYKPQAAVSNALPLLISLHCTPFPDYSRAPSQCSERGWLHRPFFPVCPSAVIGFHTIIYGHTMAFVDNRPQPFAGLLQKPPLTPSYPLDLLPRCPRGPPVPVLRTRALLLSPPPGRPNAPTQRCRQAHHPNLFKPRTPTAYGLEPGALGLTEVHGPRSTRSPAPTPGRQEMKCQA